MSNLQPFQSSAEHNPGDDPNAITEVIDLSSNNQLVTWAAVTAPIVIVKATQGVGVFKPGVPDEDRMCKQHCAGARSVGKILGLYHFVMIRTGGRQQDVRQQAREFLQIVSREQPEFVEIDFERADNEKALPPEAAIAAVDFMDELSKSIAKPRTLFYTSWGEADFFKLQNIPSLAEYKLSMADYSQHVHPAAKPWTDWFLHQYTGTGQAPGVAGNCDRYRFRGTVEAFSREMQLGTPILGT